MDAAAEAGWVERHRVAILLGIVLVSTALGLLHLFERRGDVLFQMPFADEERYVSVARDMAQGNPLPPQPYWQPPGILYVLSVIFRVFGPELLAPRLIQTLLIPVSAALLFVVGRRFFRSGVALAAALLLGLHGAVLHASLELLPAIWALFLDLLALALIVLSSPQRTGAVPRPRAGPWLLVAGGLCLGLSALFVPLVLLFVPLVALWLWPGWPGRRRLWIGAFVVAVTLPIFPVALRNYRVAQEWVPIATNGGINFYIGNNPHYSETVAIRPGRHWIELVGEPQREANITSPAAQSRYFYRKAAKWIVEHPLDAAALWARKLLLFFNGAEIPRDTDIYEARAHSRVLATLVHDAPVDIPSGLILPLALLGIAVSVRQRQRWLLVGFVGSQAVAVAAFFVSSRYRVPSLPLIGLFAASGALWLWRARSGTRARLALGVAAVIGLLVLCNLPWRETRFSLRGELDFYRGLIYARERHDPVRAIECLRRAAAVDRQDARSRFELGNVLDARGLHTAAIAAWRQAAALDPWDLRPLRRVAYALSRRGDTAGAIRALEANVAAGKRKPAHYAHEQLQIGVLRAGRGEYRNALQAFERSLRLDADYWRRHIQGFVTGALGQPGLGDTKFWRGLGGLLQQGGLSELAASALERARTLGSR